MGVDMQGLRIERHVRKQHIVHLRDGAGQSMRENPADGEILEIKAAAGMRGWGIDHFRAPIGTSPRALKRSFTIRPQAAWREIRLRGQRMGYE